MASSNTTEHLINEYIQRIRGFIFQRYLKESCDRPYDALKNFVPYLNMCGVPALVSTFPEREFSALTLVEYFLNFVIFTMDNPEHFKRDLSKEMSDLDSIIKKIKECHRQPSLLVAQQALRVEACCQDILQAINHCKYVSAGSSLTENAENSGNWRPFLSYTPFKTEDEKIFSTKLRELYIESQEMRGAEIYRRVSEICRSTDFSRVNFSDVTTDTVMRVLMAILGQGVNKTWEGDVPSERYHYLQVCLSSLNSQPLLKSDICPSGALRELVIKRNFTLQSMLFAAYASKLQVPCKLPSLRAWKRNEVRHRFTLWVFLTGILWTLLLQSWFL